MEVLSKVPWQLTTNCPIFTQQPGREHPFTFRGAPCVLNYPLPIKAIEPRPRGPSQFVIDIFLRAQLTGYLFPHLIHRTFGYSSARYKSPYNLPNQGEGHADTLTNSGHLVAKLSYWGFTSWWKLQSWLLVPRCTEHLHLLKLLNAANLKGVEASKIATKYS